MAITDTKVVRMIGVYGRPGIGKTTIAKAIYNMYADKFEGSSFLKSIGEECEKESDLVRLQELLLCDVLGVKNLMNSLGNVDRGINLIKKRLRCIRVLVILDGVTDLDQLEKLAGGLDWFGPGSRIIITTQDEQLLTEHQVSSTYRVQEMTRPEAIELFSWYAFKKMQPEADYVDHVNDVVRLAKGVPLTLVELGRLLYSTSIDFWKTTLCMEAVRYSAEQMLETTGELVLDSVAEIIVSMALESVSDSDEQMQETTDELDLDSLELVSETLESVSDSAEQMLETTDELDVTESVESVSKSVESVSKSIGLMLDSLFETDSDSD